MLDFREEFFEQEIREGFYIDETMKRMWSAQLEVLQVIAEICDRHGLRWFAAFGTLLGAIRHEGFVPWDDDMDIGMLREDYMKFLKVLPQELPEGFCCLSSLCETAGKKGFTEYHSMVLNGKTVSISSERLERFHGCPFSVGVDIFPFDYLPRNKEERNLQKALFTLVARAVQMVKYLTGTEEMREDLIQGIESCEQELLDALKALRQYCNFKVDKKIIQDKNWEKLFDPLWKLGNEVAMMYGEKESDYLVMYGDYVVHEYKKYPKAWFAEMYAATFEDFMVPIPCGYDKFLKTVYGDYHWRVRGGGQHDYPYYGRQLEMVRQKLKETMEQAQGMGLLSQSDLMAEDGEAIPEEWQSYIDQRNDGKKVLLYSNEYQPFVEHGAKALDKLEQSLEIFYERRDKVVLWWRAKPKMAQALAQIDPKLAERYQEIRDKYIKDAWGILDESTNADRAAKNCDAFYGDMGYVLQPLQNQNKPILLASYSEE